MEEEEGDGVVGNRNSNSNSGISDNSISHDVAQCLFSILRRRMNDASLRCQRKQLLPRLRKSGDGSGTGSGGGGKTGQQQRSACNGDGLRLNGGFCLARQFNRLACCHRHSHIPIHIHIHISVSVARHFRNALTTASGGGCAGLRCCHIVNLLLVVVESLLKCLFRINCLWLGLPQCVLQQEIAHCSQAGVVAGQADVLHSGLGYSIDIFSTLTHTHTESHARCNNFMGVLSN